MDGMNAHDVTFIDRLVDSNFLDHDPAPGQGDGLQGLRDLMVMFFTGFPDIKVTMNQVIAEGDIVAGAMTTEGTHVGDFMGIPAANKKVSFTELHVVRIANGKMTEHWGVGDGITMMQQLGWMPEM